MAVERERLRGQQEEVVEKRLPVPVTPELRAHVQAVARGEVRFGGRPAPEKQWRDIPRSRKRVTLWCRHGLWHESAPRSEIGGLTSDRVYGLEDGGRFLDTPDDAVSLPCARCGTVWMVPLAALRRLARDRGHQLLYEVVDVLPGVSIGR